MSYSPIIHGRKHIKPTSITIGANVITTLEWAFLDGLDQALKTSDDPTFSILTLNRATTPVLTLDGTGVVDVGYIRIIDSATDYRWYLMYRAAGDAFLFLYYDGAWNSILSITKTYAQFYGTVQPNAAGTIDLGTDTLYWNDINYKTLNDRGCPAWLDPALALELLMKIKPDATKKSVHKKDGEFLSGFDPETIPAHLRDIPTKERIKQLKKDFEIEHEQWLKAPQEHEKVLDEWRKLKVPKNEKKPPKPEFIKELWLSHEPVHNEPVEALRFDLLVYNMVTAIQEQQNIIGQLENRIKELETRGGEK